MLILDVFAVSMITLATSVEIILTIALCGGTTIISLTLVAIGSKSILLVGASVAIVEHLLDFLGKNNSKSM